MPRDHNGAVTFHCEVCEEEIDDRHRNTHKRTAVHLARANFKKRQALIEKWMETRRHMGLHAFTGVTTEEPRFPRDLQAKDWIVLAKQPLLGVEHVFEVTQYQNSGPCYYVCTLCGVSNIQLFQHMRSVSHRLQYLVVHYKEVSDFIETTKMSMRDREAILKVIETKAWPTEELIQNSSNLRSALLGLAMKINNTRTKRKRFQMAEETQRGKSHPRQKCLSLQIDEHTEDHYPPRMLERLHFYGENFAYKRPTPEEEFDSGGYWAMPPPPGPPRHPRTMGEAKQQSMPDKLAFLDWLHITEQKLAAEPVSGQDVSCVENIIGLLECVINIYKGVPRPSEICFYTKGPVNPDTFDLSGWLRLTAEYFETAWLCSELELTAGTELIDQMRRALSQVQRQPRTMGGGMDPYDQLAGRSNPYESHPHSSQGGAPYGQGYGHDTAGPSRSFAPPHQNRGGPYDRPSRPFGKCM